MKLICFVKGKITRVEENHKVLAPKIDTIITLGKLGLPFHGHRNDSKYHPKVAEVHSSGKFGKFVEILHFRVRGGDKFLDHKEYVKVC